MQAMNIQFWSRRFSVGKLFFFFVFLQLQEQEEARARWEEEFPPYEGLEDEMYSSEDEEEVYESNEEQVEEPLVLPYPDEEEDRDFFLDEMIF